MGIGKVTVVEGKRWVRMREKNDENLRGITDLSTLLKDRVVNVTAAAPQVFFLSGHCLTCQIQWALMGLLPEEENEFKTVTQMHDI